MKKAIIFFLTLAILMSGIFAAPMSEIIYPRVEIVNKTQSNSIEATEDLPTLPRQKISEITLRSDDFSLFKQRQAGDYIELTVVSFEQDRFIYNIFKLLLTFHSPNSAEFAFYDRNNKLLLRGINIAKDREEKIDLTLNGREDIVLSYLGYDVQSLPSFKIKAYLPEGTVYHVGHYCEITENRDKYRCYKENPITGEVAEVYEISAADLQLAGSTIEREIQDLVRREAIDERNNQINQSMSEEMRQSQIGNQETSIPWDKIGIILVILIIFIIGIMKHKTMKNKNNRNDDYGGNY